MRGSMWVLFGSVMVFGCGHDCSLESCGDYGGDATVEFQSCVEGSALVVRDLDDNVAAECETDYDASGIVDANGCADQHAAAKLAFCGG